MKHRISKNLLVFLLFFVFFFVGCSREVLQIKENKGGITKQGYLELICKDSYFYGDVIVKGDENFFEVSIYNFGAEIIKVEDIKGKIKILYLGNEVKDAYFHLFPVDVSLLNSNLKKYFFNEFLEESNTIFYKLEEDRKVFNIIIENCHLKFFLAEEL